jgi:CRP/FNR family nitrogen fixation transcriptional regulator
MLARSGNQISPRQPQVGGAAAGTSALDLMGAPMSYARNTEIFAEDEPAEYLYKVVSGTVRTSKLLSDGRRQIAAFHLPGDVFGLEAGELHHFSAEAIVDSTVLVARRSAVLALAGRDPEVARQLLAVTADSLDRAREHMLLLGRKTAVERLAAFLLDMADRGRGSGAIELPMTRNDIADYLGLTIETVSRTLTQLQSEAAIAIPSSRRITLRDLPALKRLNS